MLIEALSPNAGEGQMNEKCFKHAFINDAKGYGLVATQLIKAGSYILSDCFASLESTQDFPHGDRDAIEKVIKGRVDAMGQEFVQRYLSLPLSNKKDLPLYSAIWDRNSVPYKRNTLRAALVAPNVAWVNHSCFPNAHLSIISRAIQSPKSRSDTYSRMRYSVMLRACKDIPKGTEITRAYSHRIMPLVARQLYFETTYKFRCLCTYCTNPIKGLEEFTYSHPELDKILNDPRVVHAEPTLAWRAARAIMNGYEKVGIADLRVGVIWRKCAAIAGYHSDLGRAMYCLHQATKALIKIEGPFGYLHRQTLNWQDCPELLPGFGATTRGLSSRSEWKTITQNPALTNRILFMTDRGPKDYVRLSRYDVEHSAVDNLVVLPSSEDNPVVLPDTKVGGGKRKRNGGEQQCTAREKRTIREKCIDPENDFLDISRILLREHKKRYPELFRVDKPTDDEEKLKQGGAIMGMAMAALDGCKGQWDEKRATRHTINALRGMGIKNLDL